MRVMAVLVAVVVAVAVLGAVLAYLRRRLVRDPFAPGRSRTVAAAVLSGSFAVVVACVVLARVGPDALARLALPGGLGLAMAFYLLLALLVLELPRWALRRWDRGTTRRHHEPQDGPPSRDHQRHRPQPADQGQPGDEPPGDGNCRTGANGLSDPGRRHTISRVLAGTAGAVAVTTTGYGYVRARTVPTKAVTAPLGRLDPAASGLRIAVLADVHLTRGLRERSWMAETVATVNAAEVDLVAVVGDLVDGSVGELGGFAAPLSELQAPLGAYFVTGNHEYFSGANEWAAFLPTVGLRVLRNERVELTHNGVTFDVAGVDDVTGEREDAGPDIVGALAGRDVTRPVILLAHQPVLADEASAAGVDLQISGHTHGGQMWPLHLLVRLQQGHLAGLERVGDTVLYTSRGVGSWGPPVRVGAPPEITVLTLRSTRT